MPALLTRSRLHQPPTRVLSISGRNHTLGAWGTHIRSSSGTALTTICSGERGCVVCVIISYLIEYPPSTGRTTPVTNAAACEHKNITGPATSSGVPQRFIGVRATICAEPAGSCCSAAVRLDVIHPGANALTRTWSGAQAIARDVVNCA